MTRGRRARGLASLACLVVLAIGAAGPASAADVVRFVNIGLNDGLANASVSAMVQDASGFIWIGTQGGLHRWDGRSFTLYENEPFDPESLPHNLIQTMFMDDDGLTLWIGTYGGLARFDTRTGAFSSWVHDPADPGSLANDVVVSIARDAEGRLWVGTLGGLDRMDGDSFAHYTERPGTDGALASGVIRALFRDSRGWLWVGTSGGGLYRYLPGTDSFLPVRSASSGLPSDYVFSIREDGEGRLWLALWYYGLSLYDPVAGTFENHRLEDGRAYFVNADVPGKVYAGTWGGGLFELDQADGAVRRFTSDGERRWSLPHDTMYSMLVDRAGDAWIGTNGGGFSMLLRDEAGVSLYEHDPSDPGSLSSGKIISTLEDDRGRLWVSAYNGGVARLDPGASSFRHYRYDPDDAGSLPNDIVVTIYEDRGGVLWFLTNDGLARYDEGRDAFERIARDRSSPDGDAARILYDMVEEPGTGRYWIATYTSGLERWDPAAGTVARFPSVPGDPSTPSDNLVYAIAYDGRGRLWAATNGGLCRYEGDGRFVRYEASKTDRSKLPSRSIRDVYADSLGRLWVSTSGGGVARYVEETDSFEHWTKRDGLQSNIVHGIVEAADGSIWAVSTSGLSVFDAAGGRWRPFSDQGRLRYGEFTSGRFASRSGLLYFGAVNALYAIDPAAVAGAPLAPPVRFTSIKSLSEELDTGLSPWFVDRIRLGWNDAHLSLSFAALDYADPSRVQYAYMLEGFDEDWVYSGDRSYASYTNLPGGRTYAFKVKAASAIGDWGDEATELLIEVDKAPWLRWWAVLLYLAVAALGVMMIRLYSSRAALKSRVGELSALKGQLESANVQLEALAAHDGLTGLYNRRAFNGELAMRWQAAAATGEPLAALMIDIDYFKPYNDRYGHQAGDACLAAIAAAIKGALDRPHDSASRYGGEEFVALLPGADEAGAARVAEKIRAAVEGLGIPHSGSSVAPSVTASVGYASLSPDPGAPPGRLVDLADEALYRAKNGGRNRVSP